MMKTHQVADALFALANALRRMPNQSLSNLDFASSKRNRPDPSNIPAALSALTALAEFDKNQWSAIIAEYRFPIDVRPRDASRDILGKLLKFLEENPDARRRLKSAASRERSDVSPELMNALQHLLK